MSTATLTYRGRLPGVAIDPALPAVEQPVRLDVAGFVGFAEKGPLDTPVVVEDPAQYAAVFGGDLALAQDDGRSVWAQLPTAVRAFFDNGGRRCYVVRVAGDGAKAGRWAVPGIQLWRPASATTETPTIGAASAGSWSRGLSVETVLLTRQLAGPGDYQPRGDGPHGVLPVAPSTLIGLQSGDLLRLDLGSGTGLFARVHSLDLVNGEVRVDTELPFGPEDTPSTDPLGTAGLPVDSARLLRLDLVARLERDPTPPVVEHWTDLAFGPPAVGTGARPCWTEVLQVADQPDLTRSLLLRQDADTATSLVDHVAIPVRMDVPAGAGDPTPAVGPPLQEGADGLEVFPILAFTDERLRTCSLFSLLTDADQLTSLAKEPAELGGIHALLGIDEVALVAAPDATQRSWTRQPIPSPDPVVLPPPVSPPTPDWSDFRCCEVSEQGAPIETQTLAPKEPTELDGLPPLDAVTDYDDAALVGLQVALVTMCAARADQVAILSVPKHYDVAATLAWRERLRTDPRVSDSRSTATPPLGYAGLWHPWVSMSTGTADGVALLRDVPPDGVAAGAIAARELARGPWLAPAGTPLRGVLRTVPTLTATEQISLFDAHANLVTHPPGSFTLLSAHTLTDDSALLQVSVRRLLIWIRKTAMRLGQRYVFEVDNDQFRQLVQLRFDRILARLLDLGGLAAYQVVVDPTPEDRDAGRFVVRLQVAPTSPVEFITVTLSRTGEGLLDVMEA